jgi:hypothetical protein
MQLTLQRRLLPADAGIHQQYLVDPDSPFVLQRGGRRGESLAPASPVAAADTAVSPAAARMASALTAPASASMPMLVSGVRVVAMSPRNRPAPFQVPFARRPPVTPATTPKTPRHPTSVLVSRTDIDTPPTTPVLGPDESAILAAYASGDRGTPRLGMTSPAVDGSGKGGFDIAEYHRRAAVLDGMSADRDESAADEQM